MTDDFVDISGFQFRALQRVRIFDKADTILNDGICPSWIAASSRYGIIVCASGCDKLISLRSSDVHRLNTNKADINAEVTDIQTKVTNLQVEQPIALIALDCNCAGRTLSVSMRTASGAFVYLFDICAFAVDYGEQKGPVYSLRISADPNAQPCVLKWNPQQDTVFAVASSDGVLSCYSFDIEKSSSVTLIGTIKLDNVVTCISWSPKGKQLVVGDVSGYVKQYKPEMILVRVTPPPSSDNNHAMRCVGISWLATTDVLIAYSPKTGQEVDITKLCVKKDAPPQWTHFNDINFCGDKSSFDQRIEFTQLLGWKLVLCSSSRSSEIAVLGKIGSEWKVWALDDSGRIEMPLNSEHCETYPVGIAIDVSSVLSLKTGDDGSAEHPPCPIVLVLSSHGVLLAFNALSSRAEHQSINIRPEVLPSKIYGKTTAGGDVNHSGQTCRDSPDTICQASEASLRSVFPFQSASIPEQNVVQLQGQAKTNTPQSVQTSVMPKPHELLPCGGVSGSAVSQQQIRHSQNQQAVADVDLMADLREDFRKKLAVFDKQFFDLCERNDWLQNLQKSAAKQLEWNNGINLDDEMLEMEKVRTVVASWLDALENEMKEGMCSVGEQLGIANSTGRELNGRMFDFNDMHRLDKLVETLAKLEQKIANVGDGLAEMPTCNTKSRPVLTLDIDQEQQIATTAKNICKGIISRRKVLCELQQRLTTLSTRLKPFKKDQEISRFFVPIKSSISYSPFSCQTCNEELTIKTPFVTTEQQNKLLKFLTERGPVKQSEAKIVMLQVHSHEAGEGIPCSAITDIENRLLEAALMPIKTPKKSVMDVGTQSSDYLVPKEMKPSTNISTSKSFLQNGTSKLLTLQSSQFQNFSGSAINSSATLSSFMNLNSSVTTTSITTSNSSFIDAVSRRLPSGDPFSIIPQTTSSQKQLLDTSIVIKNDENERPSVGSAAVSKSMANASAVATSNATTTIKNVGNLTRNCEGRRTDSGIAVTDTSSSATTSKTSVSEKNVSFTFKVPATENQQTPAVDGSSVSASGTNSTAEVQSKDLDTTGDDGMMEAEGTSGAPTTLFSSSLFFGSATTAVNTNAAQNVFGSGLKFLSSTQPQTSSLFSNAYGNKGTSVFGAGAGDSGASVGGGGLLFSQTQQSNASQTQQQSNATSFSFSSTANAPPSSSNLFGAKSMTSGTTFGGAPSFGSKPVFGSPSPLVSAFAQQRSQHTAPTNTGFSNFAKTSTIGFGSLAACQQQQSSSSVFGGSGFGALAQQPQKSSIFGGGLNSSVTNSSSFSTWR